MAPNDPESTTAEDREKKHEFTIFIDAAKYVVNKTSMTGADIKALAHIDAQYQLYQEEQRNQARILFGKMPKMSPTELNSW
jgi:hypothetical protein